MNNKDRDYIVILHGIARSSKHMKKLVGYLGQNGFEVLNLDYPSTKFPISELIEIIQKEISEKIPLNKTIHFIGYSMGGLLVRALLHKYRPQNLGRVIQLAPPNQGSEVADFLKNFWLFKKIYGPVGQELITDQTAIAHLFGDIDFELGIIAGNLSIDPICSLILKEESDGKVTVARTKLTGMKDHIIVKAFHTFFPSHKEVQKQVLHFLQHGTFKH